MSDTPETDHLENQMGEASRYSHPILWEHSRKLERERNEWRRSCFEITKLATESRNELERQRDELATKLEDNKQSLEVAISDAQDIENAINVIMVAPLPEIMRLFHERGILATITTTAKEKK